MERLRHVAARGGRPLSRGLTVLVIYGAIATATFPLWAFAGEKLNAAIGRMRVLVPEHTARFVNQLHAAETWHEGIGLPMAFNGPLGAASRSVTGSVETRRGSSPTSSSTSKDLCRGSPRCRSRRSCCSPGGGASASPLRACCRRRISAGAADEFLRDLNVLLAAYTRAPDAVGANRRVPLLDCLRGAAPAISRTLALAAGCLEMLPLAGPLITAVVATSMAPDRALSILFVLGGCGCCRIT
jgi:hypothetical protein